MRSSRPWSVAALALSALAPFFFLTYSLANWATSQRANVGSVVFGWERYIPFLPWMIVPYWSTDSFYAASLFLCRTRAELSTHVRRLVAVQVISVAAFLMFPLRFSFARPAAGGFFGSLFTLLGGFDKPFNQAPSLHLGLTVILWVRYAAHFNGWRLWMIRIWFVDQPCVANLARTVPGSSLAELPLVDAQQQCARDPSWHLAGPSSPPHRA